MTSQEMKETSEKFSCSPSAIKADITRFYHYTPGKTYHLSAAIRRYIRNRDKYTCAYCGIITTQPAIDHILPVSLGGKSVKSNLVVACNSCNAKKSGIDGYSLLSESAKLILANEQTTGERTNGFRR